MSRIYIGQLSSRTRERDVQETFERFGRIRRIDMKNGYAFLVLHFFFSISFLLFNNTI